MAVKTSKTQAAVASERRYSRVWARYFKLHTGPAGVASYSANSGV
jgi:hypothetical protein